MNHKAELPANEGEKHKFVLAKCVSALQMKACYSTGQCFLTWQACYKTAFHFGRSFKQMLYLHELAGPMESAINIFNQSNNILSTKFSVIEWKLLSNGNLRQIYLMSGEVKIGQSIIKLSEVQIVGKGAMTMWALGTEERLSNKRIGEFQRESINTANTKQSRADIHFQLQELRIIEPGIASWDRGDAH